MGQRLREKRCLIVGGSSGLGLAAGRRFLEEGARLVIAGRSEEKGAAAVRELGEVGPTTFIRCDATDAESVDALLTRTVETLGGVDVLYHVAGVSGRPFGDGPLHECTDAGWDATLSANLTSVFRSNRAVVRHWLTAKSPGVILNMSSVLAFSPSPRFFDAFAYTAAKGAILSMSRLAAARYQADGIRVNVIAPGLIETPMAARACGNEAIREFLIAKQPLSRGPGRPEDCADAAVFLCSDEARFITGIVLPADGGWSVSP